MKRSCQRQTQVFDFPVRRMISLLPTPSALNRTISARQTCLWGVLRSRVSTFRRRRSAGLRVMEIPVRMRQTRMRSARWESPPGFKCQTQSTSSGGNLGKARLLGRDKGKRTTNLRSETTGEPALEEGERDGFCIASRWFGGGDGRLTGCRAGIRTDKIEPAQSVRTKRNRNRARTARRRIRRGRRVDREDGRLCQRQRELGQSLRNHHWLVQKDQKLSRQGRPQAGRPADDDLHRDRRHGFRISGRR